MSKKYFKYTTHEGIHRPIKLIGNATLKPDNGIFVNDKFVGSVENGWVEITKEDFDTIVKSLKFWQETQDRIAELDHHRRVTEWLLTWFVFGYLLGDMPKRKPANNELFGQPYQIWE